jgi:hypothetical protein
LLGVPEREVDVQGAHCVDELAEVHHPGEVVVMREGAHR